MAHAGLRPSRVVLLTLQGRSRTRKAFIRWMPTPLRVSYLRAKHDLSMNYWPRRILRRHPQLVSAISAGLAPHLGNARSLIDEMYDGFRYEAYADHVQPLLVSGLSDDRLPRALTSGDPAVLYTGGGIVPRALLETTGLRFLHVHPGYLPDVRGADGMLWSLLLDRALGFSCFYMAPGIDLGDVIARHRFAAPDMRSIAPRPDDATLYRALFSFLDPLLRAYVLVDLVLASCSDPAALPATRQPHDIGVSYHFMHPTLRHAALGLLFH